MKVQKKEEILDIIKKNKQQIHSCGVAKVGVFGSFIRYQQNNDSDVDLLIEFQKGQKSFRNLLKFAELSEDLLGREVDVLTPESLSPYLAPHIQKEVEYVQIT